MPFSLYIPAGFTNEFQLYADGKEIEEKEKYPVNNRHKAREMMTISEWFAIIFLSYQIEKVKNLIWEKVCVENLQTGKNNSMSR